MEISSTTALIFLPFTLPICVWAAASDVSTMKIPNKAVVALLLVFVVTGLFALPFQEYLLRYLHIVAVLVIGFVLNQVRALGAGDAKFAAAMAPFIDRGDGAIFLYLMTGVLIAALITHRTAKRISAIRTAVPNWESWTRKDFPMGLALGAALVFYFIVGIFQPF